MRQQKTLNDTAKRTMNENAKKQGLRTQIPNEQLAFSGQLVTRSSRLWALNTEKYFWG